MEVETNITTAPDESAATPAPGSEQSWYATEASRIGLEAASEEEYRAHVDRLLGEAGANKGYREKYEGMSPFLREVAERAAASGLDDVAARRQLINDLSLMDRDYEALAASDPLSVIVEGMMARNPRLTEAEARTKANDIAEAYEGRYDEEQSKARLVADAKDYIDMLESRKPKSPLVPAPDAGSLEDAQRMREMYSKAHSAAAAAFDSIDLGEAGGKWQVKEEEARAIFDNLGKDDSIKSFFESFFDKDRVFDYSKAARMMYLDRNLPKIVGDRIASARGEGARTVADQLQNNTASNHNQSAGGEQKSPTFEEVWQKLHANRSNRV